MNGACVRTWEVEAVLDGRLTGAEGAGSERHRETCASCAREWRAMSALRALARASDPPPQTALEVRRARGRLLERADANATGRHSVASVRPRWGIAVAMAALCAIALTLAHLELGTQTPVTPAVAVEIHPRAGAVWTERRAGAKQEIHLDDGTLELRLDHADAVVVTPDGEIEDVGTAFSVTVAKGRTERVDVLEGSVIVRLVGRAPFDLRAGAAWTAERPVASSAPVAIAMPADRPTPREPSARQRVPSPSAVAIAVATPSAPPASAADDATAHEFAAAMKTMADGRLVEAATLFQAFERAHAGEAKAEDAAYLRVVALDRAGRRNAARIAAREYVAHHPNGFRRKEVEALTAEPPPR